MINAGPLIESRIRHWQCSGRRGRCIIDISADNLPIGSARARSGMALLVVRCWWYQLVVVAMNNSSLALGYHDSSQRSVLLGVEASRPCVRIMLTQH